MKDWVVILQPNGVVDAVENGAPSTWVGHDLATIADAPDEVRAIAREVTRRAPGSRYVQRWLVHATNGTIEILLVQAVPLRKSYTQVNELMVRLLDVFASQAKSNAVRFTVRQEGAGVVSLDREKVTWALATLVGNALRYVRSAPQPRIDVVFCVGRSDERARRRRGGQRAWHDATTREMALHAQPVERCKRRPRAAHGERRRRGAPRRHSRRDVTRKRDVLHVAPAGRGCVTSKPA